MVDAARFRLIWRVGDDDDALAAAAATAAIAANRGEPA